MNPISEPHSSKMFRIYTFDCSTPLTWSPSPLENADIIVRLWYEFWSSEPDVVSSVLRTQSTKIPVNPKIHHS